MKKQSNFILCSNCFSDEGLKLTAYKLGIQNKSICPNCKSKQGKKLTEESTESLSYEFFVKGSMQRFKYGGCPRIQMNEQHHNQSNLEVSEVLLNDIKTIEGKIKLGFFYYGPRFWMFGEIEPLKKLQNARSRKKIFEDVLQKYPTFYIDESMPFYRLRVNPVHPQLVSEYDSPPDSFVGKGRMDSKELPILYGSPIIDICIHECRSTIEDMLYMAKLVPNHKLKLLDLTTVLDEDVNEFESLDLAIHMLFLAGKHSYKITREMAKFIYKHGYDGIIYPSYFSLVLTGAIPFTTIYGMSIRKIQQLKHTARRHIVENVALFNRPISDKKVEVECINRVSLNRVAYDITLGPVDRRVL